MNPHCAIRRHEQAVVSAPAKTRLLLAMKGTVRSVVITWEKA